MRLSIVIPSYNERPTLPRVIEALVGLPELHEIIVVDDGSTDGTRELLARIRAPQLRVLVHPQNRGKGAALRTAFAAVSGDVVVVQDADLEYDPVDIPRLVAPIRDGHADVVFGTRFLGSDGHRVLYYWHSVGNRIVTTLSNMLTDLNLTDVEVGYKAFRAEVVKSLSLTSSRFGCEVELTAKVARQGWRLYEVPIRYHGRDYAAGKKITWRDGVAALWWIVRYRLGD